MKKPPRGCRKQDQVVGLDILAARISEGIMRLGDEPGSPCTRIAFMGGTWPDHERNQGGVCQSALVKFIASILADNLPPNKDLRVG